jgi:hypothetical protein
MPSLSLPTTSSKCLRRDPLGQGESRGDNDRLLFEGPLGVAYRVDEQARRVLVLSVALFGRRS